MSLITSGWVGRGGKKGSMVLNVRGLQHWKIQAQF